MKNLDVSKLLFSLSVVLIAFLYGLAAGHYQIFPYSLFRSGRDAVVQVIRDREVLLGLRPTELLQTSRYSGSGVTLNQADKTAPGLTLISSFFDGENQMRLIRLDGTIVQRWPLRFSNVFPDPDHLEPSDRPKSEWNVTTHGALLLPDGSLVFNFEYLGLTKLDRCGALQWKLPRVTHHALERSSDGGFWVLGGKDVTKESPFPLMRPPYFNPTVMKVSAAGEILSEIPTLSFFFNNGLEALLFSNGVRGIDVPSEDITHLNDVEELSAEMAPAFPQFAAGDLLLSFRNLNLIMVVDPNTQKVKWHQTGPFIAQHDPDFQANGKISVFNNNDDRTETGTLLGGSEILEIDPATGQSTSRYGGKPDEKMFSFRRGKHQYLPNGNVLITESESGRVFEVDSEHKVVWEFINRYDETRVAIVMGATRYPESYFTVEDWSCP